MGLTGLNSLFSNYEYFTDSYIINKTLHGRAGTRILSSSADDLFRYYLDIITFLVLLVLTRGVARIFQRGGGHTVSNIIVMAFSPRNIVGCFLKKALQRGVTGTPGTPPPLRPCLFNSSSCIIGIILLNLFAIFSHLSSRDRDSGTFSKFGGGGEDLIVT